jgi:hypothetical protein
MDLHKAIRAIHSNVVIINGDTQETIIAKDQNENEVTINWTQVNAWTDPEQYKIDRVNEYPSIQDQLDMQYWDKINSTNTWQDAINAVKNKYPKETE